MEVHRPWEEVQPEEWTSVSYHIEVPSVVEVLGNTLAAVREMAMAPAVRRDPVCFYEMLAASRSLLVCHSSCSCLLPSRVQGRPETD